MKDTIEYVDIAILQSVKKENMRVRYIFVDEYGASTLVSVMTLIDGSKSYFLLMKPLQS